MSAMCGERDESYVHDGRDTSHALGDTEINHCQTEFWVGGGSCRSRNLET
jgi:hypothetical protein